MLEESESQQKDACPVDRVDSVAPSGHWTNDPLAVRHLSSVHTRQTQHIREQHSRTMAFFLKLARKHAYIERIGQSETHTHTHTHTHTYTHTHIQSHFRT